MRKAPTQVNLMPTRQLKDSIDIFVRPEDDFCQEQNCVDTTKSNSANSQLQNSQDTLPIISIFSGALGLDLGLEKAGLQVRVAVECNKFAAETIRKNCPHIPVIERKIEEVTTEEILETAGLKPGEPVIVSGDPSCQAYSTVGQRGSLSDPRGMMFKEFLRVVRETHPRFFVMEKTLRVSCLIDALDIKIKNGEFLIPLDTLIRTPITKE